MFPNPEKEMFDNLMDALLQESFTITKVKDFPKAKLDVLAEYAKQHLHLDADLSSFEHQLTLRLKRPPKTQVLLDLISAISEKRKVGLASGDCPRGTRWSEQSSAWWSFVRLAGPNSWAT